MRRPKPQKIVLLPGDINPQETTVITVEPTQQPCPERSRQRSGMENMSTIFSSAPFDMAPPSMDSFQRFVLPHAPYIPPEIVAMGMGEEEPCPKDIAQSQLETSHGLLVDLTPPEPFYPCEQDSQMDLFEPVDLLTFPPQDPFSPERRVRPPSPTVSPPPHPFSPPRSPIPEPSALHKWYSQYPRYEQAFTSTHHPITEYTRMRRERPPQLPDEGR